MAEKDLLPEEGNTIAKSAKKIESNDNNNDS